MSLAPVIQAYIGGNVKREITHLIEHVTYEDTMLEDSVVSFKINPEYSQKVINDDAFVTGNTIIFQLGFLNGEISEAHAARITDIEDNYAEKVTITIKCLDKGTVMRKVHDDKIWYNVTTKDVAQEIATKYGLELEAEDSPKVWATLPQGNRSDMELLRYMVAREFGGNKVVFIRNFTLYIVNRADDKESSYTYTYGDGDGTVLSFKPKYKESNKKNTTTVKTSSVKQPNASPDVQFTYVDQNGKVQKGNIFDVFGAPLKPQGLNPNINDLFSVGTVDPSNRQQTGTLGQKHLVYNEYASIKGERYDSPAVNNRSLDTADGSKTTKPTLVDNIYDQSINISQNILAQLGGDSVKNVVEPELQKFISDPSDDAQELVNLLNSKKKGYTGLEATLRINGNPLLKPNTVITMAGVRKRYQGNWLVVSVKHELGGKTKYITTLTLRKNGTKKVGATTGDSNTTQGQDPNKVKPTTNIKVYDGNANFLGNTIR